MSDPGLEILQFVYDSAKIDSEWSVWEDRSFTWWGGGLAQKVWAEEAHDDDGIVIYRLHARTDCVRSFDEGVCNEIMPELLPLISPLCGPILDPADLTRIKLASSMIVHEESSEWIKSVFSWAVAVQAAEAHALCPTMADLLSGEPDYSSHPKSGSRGELDDMLNIVSETVRPQGESPCTFVGPEMERVGAMLQRPPCVLATKDEDGITAEYPFGDATSLVEVVPDTHPRLGNGLRICVQLPFLVSDEDDPDGETLSFLRLNRQDFDLPLGGYFLGTWGSMPNGYLSHNSFFPNVLYRPGILTNLVLGTFVRVKWITENIFELPLMENYDAASQRRMEKLEELAGDPDALMRLLGGEE